MGVARLLREARRCKTRCPPKRAVREEPSGSSHTHSIEPDASSRLPRLHTLGATSSRGQSRALFEIIPMPSDRLP